MRETREETGREFTPEAVTGLYLWQGPAGRTVLRVAFAGRVGERVERRRARPRDHPHALAGPRRARSARRPSTAARLCSSASTTTCAARVYPARHAESCAARRARAPRGGGLTPMARVIIALSGGVDSAVAAALLLDAGHRVEALFMSNWERGRGRLLHVRGRLPGCATGLRRAGHPAAQGELRAPSTASACSRIS